MWVDLSLGQKSAPPDEALVKSREGIETVFIRQILTHPVYLATYSKGRAPTGAAVGDLAHQFAIKFGYVGADGREIRVSTPNVAAYRLSLSGDKLTVYEYHKGEIVDIRDLTTVFKDKAGYEYYFKK